MNFRQLEYFMAIYNEGSINKAAQSLYISQPALSQHLRRLEDELGVRLFDRSTSPLTLSYAGKAYLDVATQILYKHHEGLKMLQDIKDLHLGELTLGIPENRATQVLPLVLPPFMKAYPGIKINIIEAKAIELEKHILAGDIDFAMMLSPFKTPLIRFTPLFDEEILLAAPEKWAQELQIAGRMEYPIIHPQACAGKPFIVLNSDHRLRSIFDKNFLEFRPHIVLECPNVDLAHHLSSGGLGLTLVSQLSASLAPFKNTLQYFHISPEPIGWTLGICYHREKYVSKAMDAFINMAKKQLSSYPEQFST